MVEVSTLGGFACMRTANHSSSYRPLKVRYLYIQTNSETGMVVMVVEEEEE